MTPSSRNNTPNQNWYVPKDLGHFCEFHLMHSHKILTKQQGKPCYLGIWCNPCSDQCQAGRASLSCSDTEAGLGEMLKIVCAHCV